MSVTLLLAFLAAAETAHAAPESLAFEIDPRHTYIGFTIRHLMVSNVRGRFNTFSGRIVLDPRDVRRSSVDVTIETASVDSGVEARDDMIRGPNLLDVGNHPTMRFRSSRVERRGQALVAIGDLTIRGVTRRVEIPFALHGPVRQETGGLDLGVEAELFVDRRDFGMTWSQPAGGGFLVGNEVRIELEVEAHATAS